MGQGFSLATPSAGSAGIDIPQLGDVQYERSIGNGRFMKSIRGRTDNGVVLVKVLVKPYTEVKLDEYKKKLISTAAPRILLFDFGEMRLLTVPQTSERPWPTFPTPSPSSASSRLRPTDTSCDSSSTAPFTTA